MTTKLTVQTLIHANPHGHQVVEWLYKTLDGKLVLNRFNRAATDRELRAAIRRNKETN